MNLSIKDYLDYVDKFLNHDSLKYSPSADYELFKLSDLYDSIKKETDENKKNLIIKELYASARVLKFKYGGELEFLNEFDEYRDLINQINSIQSIADIDKRIELLDSIDKEKVKLIRNINKIGISPDNIIFNSDERENSRTIDILSSAKSIFENDEIRKQLTDEELYLIISEYNNVIKHKSSIQRLEKVISPINEKVWKNQLTNPLEFNNGDRFNFLIHNFTEIESLEKLVSNMQQFRQDRISTSLISNDCVGIYSPNKFRKCGFIYPADSSIITSGKHDLYTIEGSDYKTMKNKEYASTAISLPFLIQDQKKWAQNNNADFDSIPNHNEIVLDASNTKPCALYIIGYGEKDINVDYDEIYSIAAKLNLPVVEIDMSVYREQKNLDTLGESGKEYIAFHSILSYYHYDYYKYQNLDQTEMSNINYLISTLKNEIYEAYLKLRSQNSLSKENMNREINNILLSNNIGFGKDNIEPTNNVVNENNNLDKYEMCIAEYKNLLNQIKNDGLTKDEIMRRMLEIQDKEKEISKINYVDDLMTEKAIDENDTFKKR